MTKEILRGELLDELTELSLRDLCHACSSHADWIIDLVDEGILETRGQAKGQWIFTADSLQRARTAMRLQQDLDINLAGVALTLDLLDEINRLRVRLQRYEVVVNT